MLYISFESERNKRPENWQRSLRRVIKKRETGFEPAAPTLARWCSTPEPLAHKCYHYIFKVGVTGFEPATSWSQTRRSSQAEPHPVITVYINISQMILNFKYFYVPSKPHIEFRLFHKPFLPLTFWISPRPISISQLRTLLHFHL